MRRPGTSRRPREFSRRPGSMRISMCGSATQEDVTAWDLLWDAREAYARGVEHTPRAARKRRRQKRWRRRRSRCWRRKAATGAGGTGRSTARRMTRSLTRLPEASDGNLLALGQEAPEELAKPIKRQPERAYQLAPSTFLKVKVDGRDTTLF